MTDKQSTLPEAFPLAGWQVVEATGVDATAFLQAQTMNDVRELAPGRWQWNGWLNPKGRVIALFALIALDEQRYWLLLPDFPATDLVERMCRFVFRSKVVLRAREWTDVLGMFAQPEQARASQCRHSMMIDAETVELDLGGDGGPRSILIRARNEPWAAGLAPDLKLEPVRWRAYDLAHGLPRLAIDQSEAWTPQMLSLDRLHAFSLKKGCYPGQEIVARTHYLGQTKRVLARVAGNALAPGADIVTGDDRSLGTIVSSIGNEALAVVSVDRPADGWESGDSPCRELALLDGLAR